MTKLRRLAFAFAVLLALAAPVAAQEKPPQEKPKEPPKEATAALDVTGTWDIAVETPQGTMTLVSTFKQEGEKLTGMQSSQMGDTPLEGIVKGPDIAFAIVVNMQGQELRVSYTGKIDGDSMTGAIEFGSFGASTWAAKKRKSLPE